MRTLLVISGLDPSGGAGFLADARVAAEHGIRVIGVVTALTVQDTSGVVSVRTLPAETIADELALLLRDIRPDAVKLGMLGDESIASVVAEALRQVSAPLVWDPVLLPTYGDVRLFAGSLDSATRQLFPLARLVTPNVPEAEALTGVRITDMTTMRRAAVELGARGVLIKGGHLPTARAADLVVDLVVDLLYDEGVFVEVEGARRDIGSIHGTGCVLSSAIACALAQGTSIVESVRKAKAYLGEKLDAPLNVGRGAYCLV